MRAENQNSSAHGENDFTRGGFQLQSDRGVHAGCHLFHIQRDQALGPEGKLSSVGREPTNVATDHPPFDRLRLFGYVDFRHLCVLERRPPACGESCGVLHCLRHRLLHLQHRFMGNWRRRPEPDSQEWQRAGYVGLVVQGRETERIVQGRRRL